MADEKPKKADLILEKLDVLASAMDDMSAAIDEFQGLLNSQREAIQEIDSTIENVRAEQEALALTVGGIQDSMPDLNDIAYEVRSRERQDMLFEARAAMGKVAFVRMK